MDELRLTDFRCFRGDQSARLAPLTLLVGENSTGKTSFLALVRALWDAAYGQGMPDFKEPPYDLGSFDEVVHTPGGNPVQPREFRAGFTDGGAHYHDLRIGNTVPAFDFDVSFSKKDTAPAPIAWRRQMGPLSIEVKFRSDSSATMILATRKGMWESRDLSFDHLDYQPHMNPYLLLIPLSDTKKFNPCGNSAPISNGDLMMIRKYFVEEQMIKSSSRPFASSPVRSKLRRTYDLNRPNHDSEGESTLMYLFMISSEHEHLWNEMKPKLEEFGRSAHLFDQISIKRFGKEGSGPFQIQLRNFGEKKTRSSMHNLVDLGYGVSQVLPVIVALLRKDSPQIFLLQQPEIHLHPSAQAELGTLLYEIASAGKQLFVETHSDHLIDRVRMDVRDGATRLKPEDVSILYFERENLGVRIHSLTIDQEGNIVGAPSSYRKFFMCELERSMGI